jgi:hypothetical protein
VTMDALPSCVPLTLAARTVRQRYARARLPATPFLR